MQLFKPLHQLYLQQLFFAVLSVAGFVVLPALAVVGVDGAAINVVADGHGFVAFIRGDQSGNVILVRAVVSQSHFAKALIPILSTPYGISIFFKLPHPQNA